MWLLYTRAAIKLRMAYFILKVLLDLFLLYNGFVQIWPLLLQQYFEGSVDKADLSMDMISITTKFMKSRLILIRSKIKFSRYLGYTLGNNINKFSVKFLHKCVKNLKVDNYDSDCVFAQQRQWQFTCIVLAHVILGLNLRLQFVFVLI